MALFAIGDLHLALGSDKPMDIFSGWEDYMTKLEENWKANITAEDTVVVMGDVSWAMSLENSLPDFIFLQNLPGKKIILKGNHDYWWCTMSKMNQFIQQHQLNSISFLHNNFHFVEGVCICGTRSWLFDPDEPLNNKIMQREVGRLTASLSQAQAAHPSAEKLAFLHYPPVFTGASAPEIIEVLEQFSVKRCYYGHLHGGSIRWAVQGIVNGIEYKLLSADAISFNPYRIQI